MAAAPTSIRATLRHRPFRALIGGGSVYFIGNAMHVMACAWLMVEVTGTSFLAALVQTAVFLPMFLFALPAGVLADTTDRRRLMLGALVVQALLVAGAGRADPHQERRAGHAAGADIPVGLLHGAALAFMELGHR